MKVWIVRADNGQPYEENRRGIWAVCSSREAAKKCITDAPEVCLIKLESILISVSL